MSDKRDKLGVLAAGVGKRLHKTEALVPKWLTPVSGGNIAEQQMTSLSPMFMSPHCGVSVISGHGGSKIVDWVAHSGFSVDVLWNQFYDRFNNWYSLLFALQEVWPEPWDRLFVLNSDLYASRDILCNFVNHVRADDRSGGWLAVDFDRELTEESMKVGMDASRALTELGKTKVEKPVGEYIGFAAFDRGVADGLRKTMEEWENNPARAQDWYESAILSTAGTGCKWMPTSISNGDWVEIDNPSDWAMAEKLGLQ